MKATHRVNAEDGTLTVEIEFASGTPSDLEILDGVDALLSSIPRAANVKDGKAHKDTLIGMWPLFRSGQS